MGVRYYLTFSEEVDALAREHPDLTAIAKSGPWTVYRVADSEPIAALALEPAVFEEPPRGAAWLEAGVDAWLRRGDDHVVFSAGGPNHWQRVATVGNGVERRSLPPAIVSSIDIGTDRISFSVDELDVPVLVKTSYFPNWRVVGAVGPYRVTPNWIVVIPSHREVVLSYERDAVDLTAVVLTVIGMAVWVGLRRRPPPPRSDPWYDLGGGLRSDSGGAEQR